MAEDVEQRVENDLVNILRAPTTACYREEDSPLEEDLGLMVSRIVSHAHGCKPL